MKTCPQCKISKFETDFAKAIKRKDGLQSICNNCRHENYQKNKEIIHKKKIDNYNANKEVFLNRQKKYYSENSDKVKSYYKKYREDNKIELSKKQIEKQKNRRINDTGFRILQNIRRRVANVIQGNSETTKYIGCNKDELKKYLESLFTEGMSWENYGNRELCWNIDHKLPLDSHIRDQNGLWKEDSEYNKSLIHYTNLTPMWRKENRLKSNKIL